MKFLLCRKCFFTQEKNEVMRRWVISVCLSDHFKPGLRSGGGGGGGAGQHNSNTGARPSAPFRSNVYQPTEMTMILNGGAVSTASQSQVHTAHTPLSHSIIPTRLHAHLCLLSHESMHKNEGEVCVCMSVCLVIFCWAHAWVGLSHVVSHLTVICFEIAREPRCG